MVKKKSKKKPVTTRSQQEWRTNRILKGIFHNEQKMKLLADLMFLVVTSSLRDDLIGRAAQLKYAVSDPVVHKIKKR